MTTNRRKPDPDWKAIFRKISPRRRAELKKALAAAEPKFIKMIEDAREGMRTDAELLASNGLPTPRMPADDPELEDWQHLALIVGLPYEGLQRGDLTPRKIVEHALAWADRQTIQAKLFAKAANQPAKRKSGRRRDIEREPEAAEFRYHTARQFRIEQHKGATMKDFVSGKCDARGLQLTVKTLRSILRWVERNQHNQR